MMKTHVLSVTVKVVTFTDAPITQEQIDEVMETVCVDEFNSHIDGGYIADIKFGVNMTAEYQAWGLL